MDNNGGNKYLKLKFYTPEKTTRKNKKYFYFELNLHQFRSDMSREDLLRHRDNINNEIFEKLTDVLEDANSLKSKNSKTKLSK